MEGLKAGLSLEENQPVFIGALDYLVIALFSIARINCIFALLHASGRILFNAEPPHGSRRPVRNGTDGEQPLVYLALWNDCPPVTAYWRIVVVVMGAGGIYVLRAAGR